MAELHPYKKFSTWALNCINTGISILKVIILTRPVSKMPKAQSPTLLVLGTGPSFKTSLAKNPEYFQSNTVMAVNSFATTASFVQFKPAYYVMLDPGIWYGNSQVMQETFRSIQEQTSWPMVLFIPRDARNSAIMKTLSNKNVQVHYVNYVVFKGFQSIAHFLYNRQMAMPQSPNVLVAALFVGLSMGYKRIELFGADHNWHTLLHVGEDNVVCTKHVHFYENEQQLKYVPFWKMVHSKEIFRMDEIFHAWAKVFYGYVQLRDYAKSLHSEIVNRSEVSFIDAFKREPFLSGESSRDGSPEQR